MPAAAMPSMSRRVVATYVLDWLIIIAIVGVGAGLWQVTPNRHPFTLTDPDISFPFVENEKITTATLFVVTVVAPLIMTFLTIIILPTTRPPSRNTWTFKPHTWRRKIWEWHTAWLSLCLSFALSFLFTQGMKNMFGKPRPDLLSRCDPDWENQAQYALGGYPQVLNGFYLVSATICRQQDKSKLDDGFSSFPSGHATYAWAGMLYLTLFFAGKFGVAVPYLNRAASSNTNNSSSPLSSSDPRNGGGSQPTRPSDRTQTGGETKPAAPSLLLFLPLLIPICVAVYISSTRYSDFRHHPFDIIFGSLMGTAFSYFAYRLYHQPLRQGGGGSWGPRSRGRAFGFGSEAERKRDDGDDDPKGDVEMGNLNRGRQYGNVHDGAAVPAGAR
ncbi:MAG: hypothetical protein Q9173_005727 [Seirophora scorigena]